MKKYFEQLVPLERRLAIGMLVILLLVLNYVFHLAAFFQTGTACAGVARWRQNKLKIFQTAIARSRPMKAQLKPCKARGCGPLSDQSVN